MLCRDISLYLFIATEMLQKCGFLGANKKQKMLLLRRNSLTSVMKDIEYIDLVISHLIIKYKDSSQHLLTKEVSPR